MPSLREAATQALEALEYAQQDRECPSTTRQAIEALRAALAEPELPPEAQTEAEKLAYCAGWWDALAYISPAAQPKSITFRNTSDSTEILRITKDGVHANPDVPVDEAAQAVLAALDDNIKVLVKKARDDDTALLRQALEALDDHPYMSNKDDHDKLDAVLAALRQRLGETE